MRRCFKLLFNVKSFKEEGKLYNLKVLLNQTRVTFNNCKIVDFNSCDDFFKIVVTLYITMSLLQMTGLECEPNNEELIKDDDWLKDPEAKKDISYRVASSIVSNLSG